MSHHLWIQARNAEGFLERLLGVVRHRGFALPSLMADTAYDGAANRNQASGEWTALDCQSRKTDYEAF